MTTPADPALQQRLEALIAAELSLPPSLPSPAPSALALLSSPHTLGALIDHTLLSASATPADIAALARAGAAHGCAAVCVNSSYVPLVVETLKGSATRAIAVVGFPLGAGLSAAKAAEARAAIGAGAAEIDMVQHGARARRPHSRVRVLMAQSGSSRRARTPRCTTT
jgi:hypothetical protein